MNIAEARETQQRDSHVEESDMGELLDRSNAATRDLGRRANQSDQLPTGSRRYAVGKRWRQRERCDHDTAEIACEPQHATDQ